MPVYGFAEMDPPIPAEATTLLARALAEHERVWLLTAGLPPADSGNGVERWLSERAFKATDEWYDDFRLCLFAAPQTAEAVTRSGATFGEAIG